MWGKRLFRFERFLALSALLLAAIPLCALDPNRSLTQYGHEVWLEEDGLPQQSVQALRQTQDGYLWLGTQQGLARFDGVRFTVFGTDNVEALKSDYVWNFFEESSGALWICTDGGGAVRMKDGAFTAVTTARGLSSNQVCCACQDRKGRLWFGTNGAGLNLYEHGRVAVFSRKDGLPSDVILALCEDRSGTLWIGTDRGLARLSEGRFEVLPLEHMVAAPQVRMRIKALCEDAEGALWVGSYHGLFRILKNEAALFTRKDGLCNDEVVSLCPDTKSGVLWVGTYSGLCRYRGGRFEAFTSEEGLVGGQVCSLALDREGSLWFGTAGGLNRFRDTKFYAIGLREGLKGEQIYAAYEASDGSLWIGTDGGGAGRLKGGRVTAFTTRDGLTTNKVRSFLEEPDGSLLIGTDGGGILRYAGGRFTRYLPEEKALQKTDVIGLYRDTAGKLWIACRPGLFFVEKGRVTEVTSDQGLSDPNVTYLFEDSSGALWVGTDGGGLNCWQGGRFRTFTSKDGLPSNFITGLFEDADRALWVATYTGGVSRYLNGKFANVGTRNGLSENVVYALVDDVEGNFWLSGNRGISRVAKADLLAAATRRLPAVRCETYGRADGMKTSECNGGTQSSAIRTRDGLLCFSTMKGLAIMDPRRLRENKLAPPVLIEKVLADGKPMELGAKPALRPGRHRIEFRFTALSLLAPEKNRFKYQLGGFDVDWVEAQSSREAVYTIGQPGPYRFRVIAANNDGVWNEEGAEYAFSLKPHFYETLWFYAACLMAAVLTAWGGYSLRVRQLKARQEHLEKVVVERTRDLAAEREKTEELLLNILPPYIAERKKAGEGTIADHYRDVAILFADIVDFTPLSVWMPPDDVVHLLDSVFSEFDRLTERYGLEKIKTIGDCYMVVAGIPEPRPDAAQAVAEMGLDMLACLKTLGGQVGVPLELRIGINAGEAVAGVIGRRKFTYDLWSDAVNTASRMESHGEPGRIQCTEEIYRRLSDLYEFEERGEISIKGKGSMRTYFLLRRKPGTRGTL